MLQLINKMVDRNGYYRTGNYSLIIARNTPMGILADPPVEEFVFAPNPTDIDDSSSYPNVIIPDQGSGFYIDVNEVGTKVIAIRGTTGQYPKKSTIDQVLGTKGAAITSTFKGLIPGLLDVDDGYVIFQKLHNFFWKWADLIRKRPYSYSMLFLNTKDAELYQVLPLRVNKVRTSARPMSYGYAIDLQVVGEQVAMTTRTWLDWFNDIRQKIRRWQNAINRIALLTSQLAIDVAFGAIGSLYGPITQTLTSMTAGIQSFVFMAEAIEKYGLYSHERLLEAVEEMFRADTYSAGSNAATKAISDVSPPLRAGSQMIIPDTSGISSTLMGPSEDIAWAATELLTQSQGALSAATNLALDNPNLEVYANSMDLLLNVYMAIDNAPLPNQTPAGQAGVNTRDLHRAARSGSAGSIAGRESELASAALAGTTGLLGDTTYDVETRYALQRDQSSELLSLSHLASKVIQTWSQANSERISPQLSAFRKWFLGMRDPSTFAPLYKTINIQASDTIYTLARDHLGDWRRWPEIAFVNGLQYPYFSSNGGSYQRAPGESIYIPVEDAFIPTEIVERYFDIRSTHDLVSLYDVFLGFDVELNERTGDMVYSVYDVAHITGLAAFRQEVSMVLEGSGGVTPSREESPLIRIGTKSKGVSTLLYWQSVLRQWFVQDPRVDSVEFVSVRQTGDVIEYTSKLRFVGFDTSVVTAGQLRV